MQKRVTTIGYATNLALQRLKWKNQRSRNHNLDLREEEKARSVLVSAGSLCCALLQ